MERFWTLRYLHQQGITELNASLLREQTGGAWLVRADELPLVFTVMGAQGLPRGTRVRVRLGQLDDIALDVHGTVLEVLQDQAAVPAAAEAEDDDEGAAAGPIAIAVELDEAEGARTDNPPS
ncbi:MAG TPA: RNB domain-containing ribonuclease, partial [Ottowia sp.]|nr:RNB domain-containing ribonuclease [Ottowia sp.]